MKCKYPHLVISDAVLACTSIPGIPNAYPVDPSLGSALIDVAREHVSSFQSRGADYHGITTGCCLISDSPLELFDLLICDAVTDGVSASPMYGLQGARRVDL